MATLNLAVSSSTDDARVTSGGSLNLTITTQYLGIKDGIDYYMGLRWQDVTIDQGDTINSAVLDLYNATIGEGTTVELLFEGHDADNVVTYSASFKPTDITPTTATVTDSVSVSTFETAQGFGNVTWDVTAIIQEIINRPGWVNGNSLAIRIRDNGSSAANNLSVSTYDRAADRGAKLTIDYGAPTPPPVVPNTWLSRIGAWVYPGAPALNADEEYSDGRYIHFLNCEYLKVQTDGTIDQWNDPADGENAYSVANAAEVKRHSSQQFVTLGGDGGAGDSIVLAKTGAARQADFDQMSDLINLCGFDGIDVDIEGFGSWSTTKRDNFYSWLTALATDFHSKGLLVNVDMPPLWTKPNDGSQWDFEILTAINVRYADVEATGVDYITIMCYDHQYDVGVDGQINAVAPEGWITAVDTYVRSQVTDESKLCIGLNSYGYSAPEASPYSITILTKTQTDAIIDLSLGSRDTNSGEMFYDAGAIDYVWCDDITLNQKRAFLEGLGYKRICVWHLGGNDWFTDRADIGRVSPLPGFRRTM